MFSSYRSVVLLSLIMTVFFFVPFWVSGFSTDVWIRLDRIMQWHNDGFPWGETLSVMQNYPYGHEMHWTRPLDLIGYIFAWPFIPNWGLKKSLEIMAYYVPILVLCVGVCGFFYGLRGYMRPKSAFLAFWLFFWGVGYVWGQSTIGYYDHHVFHFATLVWVIALVMRFFLYPERKSLLVWAGALTAFGTWLTAEFFINLYIVSVPFMFYWLFYNRSLRPLMTYVAACTVTLLAAILFDHPIAGFMTLDFYRVSLFHVILGTVSLLALTFLDVFFKYVRTDFSRRLVYFVLTGVTFMSVLLYFFSDVLVRPMNDPSMAFWLDHVGEMRAIYNTPRVIYLAVLPFVLSIGWLLYVFRRPTANISPAVLLCATGLCFYAALIAFYVRVGVSAQAFFVFLVAFYFNDTFFPREKGFKWTAAFVVFYMVFMGTILRGDGILTRVEGLGFNRYYDAYKENQNVVLPEKFKQGVIDKFKKEQEKKVPKKAASSKQKKQIEDEKFSCTVPDAVFDVIRKDAKNGAIFVDIFTSPQVIWETGKPVLSGPYHTNLQGARDVFRITYDRPPFTKTKEIADRRHITQFLMFNPKCFSYLFDLATFKRDGVSFDNTFYHTVYYQKKNMPNWLKLEYVDPDTQIKIFRVVPPKKTVKKSN